MDRIIGIRTFFSIAVLVIFSCKSSLCNQHNASRPKKSVLFGEKGTLIKNSVIASVSRLPLTLPRLFVPPLENPQMSGQARVGKGTGATEEKQKRKSFGISPKDYNIPGTFLQTSRPNRGSWVLYYGDLERPLESERVWRIHQHFEPFRKLSDRNMYSFWKLSSWAINLTKT